MTTLVVGSILNLPYCWDVYVNALVQGLLPLFIGQSGAVDQFLNGITQPGYHNTLHINILT